MTASELYLKYHRESGLQVGDRVKVLRAAKDYELGWDNVWAKSQPTGEIQTITDDLARTGFELNREFSVPYFVLKLVERPKKEFRKELCLTPDSLERYTAIITRQGVKVGCQTFTHAKLDELHALSVEARRE